MECMIYKYFVLQRQVLGNFRVSKKISKSMHRLSPKNNVFICRAVIVPSFGSETPIVKSATVALTRYLYQIEFILAYTSKVHIGSVLVFILKCSFMRID